MHARWTHAQDKKSHSARYYTILYYIILYYIFNSGLQVPVYGTFFITQILKNTAYINTFIHDIFKEKTL